MGRRPRLPLTVFEHTGVTGHQSLDCDHLAYCDLATDLQQRANDVVRKHHALTVSRVNRRNFALADALRLVLKFVVGWAWVYKSVSNIYQGVKPNTDANVINDVLALNWTGLYKVLVLSLCSSAGTPDGFPLGDNLFYLDLPSDLPSSDGRRHVAIERCKSCDNPHDSSDMPKYSPAGLTQYVLNNVSNKSHPYLLRTSLLKTTFGLPLNDSKCRKSPATSRSGDAVASSRCYTRCIGRGSPNCPGHGKWTFNSLSPTLSVIRPALRTSTANQPPLTPDAHWRRSA